MRAWWIAACFLAACSFRPSARSIDAGPDSTTPDAPDADPTARITTGLIGLWTLDDNAGALVGETSGLTPAAALTITDPAAVMWTPGALVVTAPVDINSGFGNANLANRLIPPCKVSNEVTLEAWVTPANVTQTGINGQPARVMTLTVKNIGGHLIGLGQSAGVWTAQVKTSAAGIDTHGGNPVLENGTVTTALTHLVVTSTATTRTLYVNGIGVSDANGGLLDSWASTFSLAMGGDPAKRNTWLGTIHLVALYDRALSDSDVMTNYLAGP